jgi:hypothetical protein
MYQLVHAGLLTTSYKEDAMFWKKKKKKEVEKAVKLLELYLTGSTVLLPGRERTPNARAGLQVFILGMVDMLRQVQKVSWEDFLQIYKTVLDEQNLSPSVEIETFVDLIGKAASSNKPVENVMILGAQSIQRWVGERDANGPLDLIGAVKFADNNADSFSGLARSAGT